MKLRRNTGGEQNHEPVADVVRRVAHEIRDLRAGAAGTGDAIGSLLHSDIVLTKKQFHDLQFLDLLCQSLDCLGLFLDNTADGLHPEWQCNPIPAAAALPLHKLVLRLSTPVTDNGAAQAIGEGDCTFF